MTRRYNGTSFTVYPGDNEHLTVCKTGSRPKTVKVVQDYEYTYKLQKTQIKASGGAQGLFKFLDDAYFNGLMECLADKVIDWIINHMKEAAQC